MYHIFMTQDIFSFVIYLIHACANLWNETPAKVYNALKKSGCIEKYLVPNYEILHTQGTNYLVQDISSYLKSRNVAV